jgi:hypothetical protein
MTTNTGGPAFPQVMQWHNGNLSVENNGMTLRDYFAAQALTSVNLGIGVSDHYYEQTAKHCYALADFMLKARNQ